MIVNHKPSDIEHMKRKAYDVLFRMHVCRLVTNQAKELHKLFCNKERYNSYRLEDIENYRKLLNKLWMNLKERETLLFQEMIDLDFNGSDRQSVMSYEESRYTDDYAIMEMYGIILGDIEDNERRINSIRY